MSKFATMASIINGSECKPTDHQRRSHTLESLRPPPVIHRYSSLSRSRSSRSNHPVPKSKMPRLIVDSVHRRNPQPDGVVLKKSESMRGRAKKSSKLRSIISIVFPGHRRTRSSSLSSRNSNLSSSSSTSRSSIGAKNETKRKNKKRQNSDGIIVNSAKIRGWRLRRGNSLPKNGRRNAEEEERYELCKKKILMGLKCKPLNLSGKLRYDEDGVLVPDPLPPCNFTA